MSQEHVLKNLKISDVKYLMFMFIRTRTIFDYKTYILACGLYKSKYLM